MHYGRHLFISERGPVPFSLSEEASSAFITLFVFPFDLKTLFISQENIRCMPGYYEKKAETLNENVEIKYFK